MTIEAQGAPECLTYSVEDAGRILGYSRNTAYEAVQRGELPVIRFGRKFRVPKAAIQRILDNARGSGDRASGGDRLPAAADPTDKRAAGLTDAQIEAIGRAAVAETNARYAMRSRRATP